MSAPTPTTGQGDIPSSLVPQIASVLSQITHRNRETTHLSEKLKAFHSLELPPIGINDYVRRIVRYAYCSPECFIFALIYLDRLITTNQDCFITPYNVHRLLITSVLAAAKSRDDIYYSNAYYSAIGGIPNSEINKLEVTFLVLIKFNLFISPEVFQQYKSYLVQRTVAAEGPSSQPAQSHSESVDMDDDEMTASPAS
eukprot:NODE_857_length_1275_cov_252.349103_g652_i0.p1 GENE.NODE_857_length_1275_cov_252.349103_g652_i0~~NODE_857_length_1275_cov_252.349103_g652_i0.p1  ORF type:complete len:198 (+),score=19.24 NODE_857_length_1275_cov_252.349103_g652_i0:154-747(+)